MASLAQRKQKVNQLRKAHFPLGFQNNQNVTSQYRQEYVSHPVQQPQSAADKKSHFTIGSDEPSMAKNSYQSEFKQQFPTHAPQSLPCHKRSNDENNIVLGFNPTKPVTNYKDEFGAKEGDRGKQNNQRVISIDLGDTLTDFTTSYNRHYDGAPAPRRDQANNNNSATHLVLGYDNSNYATSNQTAHGPKPNTQHGAPQRSYGTNVVLGADTGYYHSEQKEQFAHKESGYKSVDKEKVLDFKSAHFQFGFPQGQTDNVSEAQGQYNAKPLAKVELGTTKPTHVELKADDKNYFQSSYADQYPKKEGAKAQILSKNGRKANVIIGLGTETYNSESKEQFGPKVVERVKGKGTEGSIDLGDGTSPQQLASHSRQIYNDKSGMVEKNRVGRDQIDKKRVQNFVVGFTNPDYKLHSNSYGQAPGETNKLTRETIDKMRGTNIVFGDTKFQPKPVSNSSYGWKKNDDF